MDQDIDKLRLKIGAAIIIAAMVILVIALLITLNYFHDKAADVAAVLGAITTFLGTAIGLIFGTHAGQAGASSAATAAKAATETTKAAAQVASNAAQMVADMGAGGQVTPAAMLSTRSLRQSNRALHAIAAQQNLAAANSALRTALLADPNTVHDVVSEVVTGWVGKATNTSPDLVDTSQKIASDCNITGAQYLLMCDDCTAQINGRLSCQIVMDGAWRKAHDNATLDDYIADTTLLVLGR